MNTLKDRQLELESASKRMQDLLIELQKDEKGLGFSIGKRSGDVIRNVIIMRNAISAGLASSVCRIFPQISYKWLFAGQGPMLMPVGETPVKIEPVEKTESSQSEFIIELLKDKVKSLEEKVEERDKTIAKLRRLGGSGTIPKPIPETILSKKNG